MKPRNDIPRDRLGQAIYGKLKELNALFVQYGAPDLTVRDLTICNSNGEEVYRLVRSLHHPWKIYRVSDRGNLSPITEG